MLEDYLIIHKSILPDYYDKVLEVKRLMESGKMKEVSQAVKQVGISRSTYYKYKDYILEPVDFSSSHKAVMSMMLDHEPGVLSAVLGALSAVGCSVLTISQSLPIRGFASVTICLDVSSVTASLDQLIASVSTVPGVENPKLIALE